MLRNAVANRTRRARSAVAEYSHGSTASTVLLDDGLIQRPQGLHQSRTRQDAPGRARTRPDAGRRAGAEVT